MIGNKNGIDSISYGRDKHGETYIKIEFSGEKTGKSIIFSVSLLDEPKKLVSLLNSQGIGLFARSNMENFKKKIDLALKGEASFNVISSPGLYGKHLVLVHGVYPPFPVDSKLHVVLQGKIGPEIARKFRVSGTLAAWMAIPEQLRGNSRAIFLLCTAFCGPLAAVLMPEPILVGLVGRGGWGKTPLMAVVSSIWGWDSDPVLAEKYGFGVSFNGTDNFVEQLAPQFNGTVLCLDEARSAGGGVNYAASVLNTAFRLSGGVTKGRLNGERSESFYTPGIMTLNHTVRELGLIAKEPIESQHLERLVDIPAPSDCSSMFETLNDYKSLSSFFTALFSVARENHGVAGTTFATEFLSWCQSEPEQAKQWLLEREAVFCKRARKSVVDACNRDLTRLIGRFARIYAAGCAAARFGCLPYKKAEMLDAVLTCFSDNVALNAAAFSASVDMSGNHRGTVGIVDSPRQRLAKFVADSKKKLIDLDRVDAAAEFKGSKTSGFLETRDGDRWILLQDATFTEIMGGTRQAKQFKRELDARGDIAKAGGGKDGDRYSVKRQIGNERLPVVAIRLSAVDSSGN